MSLLLENPILRRTVIILLFTTIVCLLPLFIFLTLFLLFIRSLITLYTSLFYRDYGDLLSGMNNFFSSDSPYDRPMSIVVGSAILEGKVTEEEWISLLERKLKEFQSHKSPWFPELKQYLTTIFGFSVWRNESDFKIKDHVGLLKDLEPSFEHVELTEENMSNMCYKISKIPFKNGKSPWELQLHHNVKLKNRDGSEKSGSKSGSDPGHTILFVRLHHTLCDALSCLKLMGHLFDQPETFDNFMTKFKKSVVKVERTPVQKLWFVLSYPILGLYEVADLIMSSWDNNAWHKSAGLPKIRKSFLYTRFQSIPKERIKRLREKLGNVKLFTIFLTAFTSGIRRYMEKNGIQVPREMHTAVSIPLPKRANRLSNNITNMLYPLPLALTDRSEILQYFEEKTAQAKFSRYPLTMLFISMFIGLFPRSLVLKHWIFTTVAATNFPGFEESFLFNGHQILNINALACLPASTTGVYFWVAGFMDDIFVNLGVSDDIISSQEKLNELRRFITEELNALEYKTEHLNGVS